MADRSLFSATSDEGVAIYVIPALGGTEHRVYSGPAGFFHRALDWSPDGKVLAFTESQRGQDPLLDCIAFARRFHHTTAYVTVRSGARLWSRFLARRFDRGFRPRNCCGCGGGPLCRVRRRWRTQAADPRQHVVMAASHLDSGRPRYRVLFRAWRSRPSLWRISASGGTPRPVAGVGVNAMSPSISPKGNQLVYQQMS